MSDPQKVRLVADEARFRLEEMTGLCLEPSTIEPTVKLWRQYRNGIEVVESLPPWLAQQVLAEIPVCEPEVARAKLIRSCSAKQRR